MEQEPRHLVITGGQGGLGAALVEAFASRAWRVEAPGRNELDVSRPEAVKQYFADRRVDLLVCAAGMVMDAPLARLGTADWDTLWRVNYKGALDCAHAAIGGMEHRGSGHVVFLSSHSAIRPPPGQVPYAAAKAALLGLVTDLSQRHGREGIRVNAVLPGFLETAMTRTVKAGRRKEVVEGHALGRLNTPRHAANFIRFLEEDLPHTSGQVFQLDSRPHIWPG